MNQNLSKQLLATVLGGAIIIALLLRDYDGALIVAASSFLSIAFFCFITSWQKYGLLTWRSGIPIFYIVYFVLLPLILNDVTFNSLGVSDEDIAIGLWYATFGVSCFWVGVYLFSPAGLAMPTIHQIRLFGLLESYRVIVLFVVLGGISRLFSIFFGYSTVLVDAGSIGSIVAGALEAFNYFLLIGMLVAWRSYFIERKAKHYILGLVALVISVGAGFFANSKAAIVTPLMLVAILNYAIVGRIPVKNISILALLFVFVAYPVVTSFRYIQQVDLASYSRADVINDYIDYLVSLDWLDFQAGDEARTNFSRSLLAVFSVIVRDSGSSVPFVFGETYLHGISAFIPRFIYPDKPDLNIGNFFGKIFGVISSQDDITNIAPTMMGEFFANFGVIGLGLGMFFMGLIAVIVDSTLIGNRVSWLLPIMIMSIGWQESVVGHTFLPFIKNMVFVFLFLYLINFLRFARASNELVHRRAVKYSGR